jgi:hypothetical protein
LERENSALREQLDRVNELLEKDKNRNESRRSSFARKTNEVQLQTEIMNAQVVFHKSNSMSDSQKSISQTIIEMREAQILKLQAELDERTKEVQVLKTKLNKYAQSSNREILSFTGRLSQFEDDMQTKELQISDYKRQIEQITESHQFLQKQYDLQIQNLFSNAIKNTFIWASLLLHGKTMIFMILFAILFYI